MPVEATLEGAETDELLAETGDSELFDATEVGVAAAVGETLSETGAPADGGNVGGAAVIGTLSDWGAPVEAGEAENELSEKLEEPELSEVR